jgi:hypothetical protein
MCKLESYQELSEEVLAAATATIALMLSKHQAALGTRN